MELVALTKKPPRFGNTVSFYPDATISSARKPDLVLIPSSGPKVPETLRPLRSFVPWIQERSGQGARLVSMCTGAFWLAETGLLDRRTATTHWFFADLFRKSYPQVDLHPDRLIIDDGNVITGNLVSRLDSVSH
jgi:transcriptional regulator GlxA family with amidase domain